MLKRLDLSGLSTKNKIEHTISYGLEMVVLIILGISIARAGNAWLGALMITIGVAIVIGVIHHFILTPYFAHLAVTEVLAANSDNGVLSVTETFVKGRRRDILNHMEDDAVVYDGAILRLKPEGDKFRIISHLFQISKAKIRIDDGLCVAKNPIEFFKIQRLVS